MLPTQRTYTNKKKDRKLMSFSGFQKKKTQFEYKIIKEQNNLKKSIINY